MVSSSQTENQAIMQIFEALGSIGAMSEELLSDINELTKLG